MIEITVQPSGDIATAETPKEAQLAARQLMREARRQGMRPTAAFTHNGTLIRERVTRRELA